MLICVILVILFFNGLVMNEKSSFVDKNKPFRGPLFVIGMPRSGTKLLRTLLNNHHDIFIPEAETEILPRWYSKFDSYGDLSKYENFSRFVALVKKDPLFYFIKDSKLPEFDELWFDRCNNHNLDGVFEALVKIDTKCGNNNIWGDKSPSYIRHVPLLKTIYPKAKFIHIVRDPRDYCLSVNKAWGKNIFRAVQRWQDDTLKAHNDISKIGCDGAEILYEDLLENPKYVMKKICEFIGIPFSDEMLQITQSKEGVGDAKGKKYIVRGNKNKWLSRMDHNVVCNIESICIGQIRCYKYPAEWNGAIRRIGRARMAYYKFLDGVNLVTTNNGGMNFLQRFIYFLRYSRVSGNRM
jgi:hypothetical protein